MAQTTTQQNDNEKQFEEYASNAASQIRSMEDTAGQYEDVANAAPTQYERHNYLQDIMDQYRKGQPSEEELKRENNKRKIAALGDGLVALANMAGAIGGATPLTQQKTLTEAQKARFEEALKMRQGYMTRQEYNAAQTQARQQQRTEDNYYNRLRAQEESQRKNASNYAFKYRQAAEKAWTDLYNKAKALGISEEKAKSIIEKNRAAVELGRARVANQTADTNSKVAKRNSDMSGKTVVTTDENGTKTVTTKPGVATTTPVTTTTSAKPANTPQSAKPASATPAKTTTTGKKHGSAGTTGAKAQSTTKKRKSANL